jgi:hypothetical protein
MDMYSTLQSPSISLFSPGLHHRLSSSYLGSSHQRLPPDGPRTPADTEPLRIPFLHPGQKDEESALPYPGPIRKLEDQFITPASVYVPEVVKAPGSSFLQGLLNGKPSQTFLLFSYFSLKSSSGEKKLMTSGLVNTQQLV